MTICTRCNGSGWTCEAHPDLPWPHDDCEGPGEPCLACQHPDRPTPPPDFVSLMGDSLPFYAPNKPVGIPRQRARGVELWRLNHDGHVQSCELRDDSRAGAGWDVLVLEDGEPLFSRRCADERGARYVADSFRRDLLQTGLSEA